MQCFFALTQLCVCVCVCVCSLSDLSANPGIGQHLQVETLASFEVGVYNAAYNDINSVKQFIVVLTSVRFIAYYI